MPRKAIAKKDETPTTPDSFMVKEVRIQSKLTRETVEHLQQEYVEGGLDINIHFCGKSARVNRPVEGDTSFFVYYDQFRLGLHFPLCTEFTEVLKHYGIVLAQLVPNSVASIMSFIIYLRRIKRAWSLELFHLHFYCRFLQGGYAQFSTTSILTIQGMENKVENWKAYFCRVSSPMDIDVPRAPSAEKIESPPKKSLKDLPVLVLDVRQYAKDRKVLKKMIYSDKYIELTAEEWEESDRALANLPKKSPKKPEGLSKSRAKSPIEWEAVEEQTIAEADRPSTSRAHEETGEPTLLIEGAQARISAPRKRKCLVQGNLRDFGAFMSTATTSAAAMDTPEDPEEDIRVINKKITIDMEEKKATVDLSKEWFPSSTCLEGVAQSMGLVLYSANMGKKIEETPLPSLRDQFARHHAAAWSMGGYFGLELEKEREKNASLENRIESLEKSLQLITNSFKEKHKAMEEAEQKHNDYIKEMEDAYQESTREAFAKQEKDHQEKMGVVKASNRRLRSKIQELKESSAQDIESGIYLCLEQLSKFDAVLPEWNDAQKIKTIIVENMEEVEKDADSEETDSDEASTAGG